MKYLIATCAVIILSAAIANADTSPEMVAVKGGCFKMGDTMGGGDADERPVHEVCLPDFEIGKFEVTQGLWREVMGTNPSAYQQCGDGCPVEQVSWKDAQAFISALNNKTGKKFRLPTEAEWEFAARSGGMDERWSGTSDDTTLGAFFWFSANSAGHTHPAGQKSPNGLGIYDMSGNVREWVADWYAASYPPERDKNPKGPYKGTSRVVRGGSWYDSPALARTSSREGHAPAERINVIGFRLAK